MFRAGGIPESGARCPAWFLRSYWLRAAAPPVRSHGERLTPGAPVASFDGFQPLRVRLGDDTDGVFF